MSETTPTPNSPRTLWALYVGTPKHGVHGISLHLDEREALFSAVDYAEAGDTEYDVHPDDYPDLDDLRERVAEVMEESGDDWYIQEVQLP
jgi:hypothetical protein